MTASRDGRHEEHEHVLPVGGTPLGSSSSTGYLAGDRRALNRLRRSRVWPRRRRSDRGRSGCPRMPNGPRTVELRRSQTPLVPRQRTTTGLIEVGAMQDRPEPAPGEGEGGECREHEHGQQHQGGLPQPAGERRLRALDGADRAAQRDHPVAVGIRHQGGQRQHRRPRDRRPPDAAEN